MTTLTRQDLNFGQVVADVLCEFLEVAVHLILYVREVYPVGIFQKRKKYNVPVQMSCHPELNRYIQDTLHCVKPLLEKNDVEKVVVVILDKEHRPVEKFVFEITQPPLLSIREREAQRHGRSCLEPPKLTAELGLPAEHGSRRRSREACCVAVGKPFPMLAGVRQAGEAWPAFWSQPGCSFCPIAELTPVSGQISLQRVSNG
ncbi:mitotic spindle assembly checkpoint protein MAD2B isoform X1 [Echinops telfairi]|uniref:Mitotic spindle assembly checkpoint protein MAD2B isoform X1 n=1 Tax=Echinops telfairi TaxID=9371 RepID=A0AC55DTY8_ECHTE|nr:mitotic spindle assembly checkpoint protein MAD2B isoform X1 [Echinops telfairi]